MRLYRQSASLLSGSHNWQRIRACQASLVQIRTLIQPSFDYKFIRDNADQLLENAVNRNVHNAQPHRVGKLYDEYRALVTETNTHRSMLNDVSKKMAAKAKARKNTCDFQNEMTKLREQAIKSKQAIQDIKERLHKVEESLRYEAAKIPNLSHPDTPVGDESKARVICVNGNLHTIGTVPLDGIGTKLSDTEFQDHYDLALKLGIVDMEAGAKVAGSRFHYWRGAGALLELALVQYAMTRAVAAGFTPHITPDAARSSIIDACGFRPRSHSEEERLCSGEKQPGEASQIYRMSPVAEESSGEEHAADPLCLVATAEIPLVAMKQKQILENTLLPMRLAGLSHCFRAEAGARGRDTRGIYRLHQFTKVELVTLAHPENSENELSRLVDFQKSLFADLGLTFRVLQMPTFELGASAYQKFDIEAWMPGRKSWGEISSASNCTDYQARRLGIRVRTNDSGSNSTMFVHTLNATAVAVPRLVVALLESFQRPNGHVVIPAVLRPWMMGIETLVPPSYK
ncbi:seryl-tRNA synthetase [Coemansia brasiliensis]|uniref:serine--tRNA ligase n=1 Tax=Coemansia brasiliensis TaxID=2650707 RepID=A0A9W8M2H1_9FUNG|nr:seryl-tRNA synthetase [Coemansia brasiliensis]